MGLEGRETGAKYWWKTRAEMRWHMRRISISVVNTSMGSALQRLEAAVCHFCREFLTKTPQTRLRAILEKSTAKEWHLRTKEILEGRVL